MPSDPRAQRAREAHQASSRAVAVAAQERARRDALVRSMRAEDPDRWTYGALARAVGCSVELIAKIVQERTAKRVDDAR